MDFLEVINISIQADDNIRLIKQSVESGIGMDEIERAYKIVLARLTDLDASEPMDNTEELTKASEYMEVLRHKYTVVPMTQEHPNYLNCRHAVDKLEEILFSCVQKHRQKGI